MCVCMKGGGGIQKHIYITEFGIDSENHAVSEKQLAVHEINVIN